MARRCSDTRILFLLDEPSRRIRWVDCTKLWRNANFELLELLCALSWTCQALFELKVNKAVLKLLQFLSKTLVPVYVRVACEQGSYEVVPTR